MNHKRSSYWITFTLLILLLLAGAPSLLHAQGSEDECWSNNEGNQEAIDSCLAQLQGQIEEAFSEPEAQPTTGDAPPPASTPTHIPTSSSSSAGQNTSQVPADFCRTTKVDAVNMNQFFHFCSDTLSVGLCLNSVNGGVTPWRTDSFDFTAFNDCYRGTQAETASSPPEPEENPFAPTPVPASNTWASYFLVRNSGAFVIRYWVSWFDGVSGALGSAGSGDITYGNNGTVYVPSNARNISLRIEVLNFATWDSPPGCSTFIGDAIGVEGIISGWKWPNSWTVWGELPSPRCVSGA